MSEQQTEYRIVTQYALGGLCRFLQFKSTETTQVRTGWFWWAKRPTYQEVECWRFVPTSSPQRVLGHYLCEQSCPTTLRGVRAVFGGHSPDKNHLYLRSRSGTRLLKPTFTRQGPRTKHSFRKRRARIMTWCISRRRKATRMGDKYDVTEEFIASLGGEKIGDRQYRFESPHHNRLKAYYAAGGFWMCVIDGDCLIRLRSQVQALHLLIALGAIPEDRFYLCEDVADQKSKATSPVCPICGATMERFVASSGDGYVHGWECECNEWDL